MRILLAAALAGLVSTPLAHAGGGGDGGRCSAKHLAGNWAATLAVVLPDASVADAYCTLSVGRDGALGEASSCLVGDLESDALTVTGTLAASKGCAVTGSFDVEGLVIGVKGQVSHDRDLFLGVVSGEGWMKPVQAIRTAKSRGHQPPKKPKKPKKPTS